MKKSGNTIILCILITFLLVVINAGPARCAFVDEKIEQLVKEGDTLIGEKKYQDALKKYQEASEMNPEKAIPHYKIGVAYYFLKDNEKAVEAYKKAIKLDPKYVKALNNLALIYDKQDEDAQAEIMYKRALALKPEYKLARYNLGALLIRMEKLDEAEQEANKLAEMDPKYYKAYYLLGLICEHREKYHKAEEMYLKVLSINADFSRAVDGMKRVKENLDRNSAYKKELEKAEKIVRFKMIPEYKFLRVEDILSGSRVITLRYGEEQDVFIVKFPDSHVLGDKSLEELIQDENNEDFKNFLKDMRITSVELTGAGRFKEQETVEKTEQTDSKEDGIIVVEESKEKDKITTAPEDKAENKTDVKPEVKKDDKETKPGDKKPESEKTYRKTREYIKFKCIHQGSDREGIMVAFKPAENMNRMLYISLAPLDKFSISAARIFYNHIKAPEVEN